MIEFEVIAMFLISIELSVIGFCDFMRTLIVPDYWDVAGFAFFRDVMPNSST